jgi:adenylate cyclase
LALAGDCEELSRGTPTSETRKIAAILVADVVGYSRLAGADEERTLARLRALRSDLIDPTIALHRGRAVKRTGDGSIIEFRSVVDAVRCAIEVQSGMVERNAGVPPERRIEFRVGIHLGDIVEESDGDLMGDGVNIASRLEGIAKPGAICLSEDAYRQVKGRLEITVSDLGQTQLKNIADPIRVYSLEVGQMAYPRPAPAMASAVGSRKSENATPTPKVHSGSRRWSALAVALGLALFGAGAYVWHWDLAPRLLTASVAEDKLKTVPRLSIVVLPFENISGDPEQDYFAEGITDDLTTDLSHLADSFVIARNTASTYKGKPIDAKQVGRDLGVRYLLEGSVRRSGEKIAVNAQLISTETGSHIWADRFEGERSKLGQLQFEFVARLANSLGAQLVKAESLRAIRERPDNPDAADLALQGWALLNQPDSKERFAEAIKLFERALSTDSQNIRAMTGLALTLCFRAGNQWTDNYQRDTARADGIVKRALILQPENPMLHYAYACVLSLKNSFRAAITENEAAIALDGNTSKAYGDNGLYKMLVGRSEEGLSDLQTALRLSPYDSANPNYYYYICLLNNALGRWEQAIDWCTKSLAADPELTNPLFQLAAANAWAGRDREAREAVAKIEKALPGSTIQNLNPIDEWASDPDPTFKAQWARIVEGLRKAGLPDEPTAAKAHLVRAEVLASNGHASEALKEAEAVIADDPNNAEARGLAGYVKMYLGRGEEGVADLETALRLSPNDKRVPAWLGRLCYLETKVGNWEAGIEWCEKAIAAGTPEKSWVLSQLAGAYSWLGRDNEAKDAVARLHDLDPHFTVQTYLTNAETRDNPTYRAQATRAAEGLRKAGVPEE